MPVCCQELEEKKSFLKMEFVNVCPFCGTVLSPERFKTIIKEIEKEKKDAMQG
ncbi:MAG: hypothetical protein HYV52_02255 [Parcubacteria group bacterium]|nr:hypothetical protein [Parcubacteria group bacterium]